MTRSSCAFAAGLLTCLALLIPSTASASAATVIVAGDIASCRGTGDSRTAALVARQDGLVMTAGDNVYPEGSIRQYRRCYQPTWGSFLSRTRPAPGNHDWRTPGAAGYFTYFGDRAGPAGRGWYTFRTGDWRVYVLASTPCVQTTANRSGCGRGSGQYRWLKRHLANHPSRCTLVVMHHPRFSSGIGGNNRKVAPLLWLLYRAGADLVINGHDHSYERFAPARPDGRRDRAYGLRQIVAGTGGAHHTPFRDQPAVNSVVRSRATFGVVRLRLDADGYRWRLLRVDGRAGDHGQGSCHGKPAG